MDEQALENIAFHQDVIKGDNTSPLHLIREKEMEISGRVLKAKKQAEEIIAESRKQAATLTAAAQEEVAGLVAGREKEIMAEAEREAAAAQTEAAEDRSALEVKIKERHDDAVKALIDMVVKH